MFFFKDDTIITGKDGIVDIQLMDGVVIRVKQNTKLRLQDIIVGDNSNSIKAKLKLESGKVFAKTEKKLAADSSFLFLLLLLLQGFVEQNLSSKTRKKKDQTLVSDGAVNIETIDEKVTLLEKNPQ